jgi:hypothetical protein
VVKGQMQTANQLELLYAKGDSENGSREDRKNVALSPRVLIFID